MENRLPRNWKEIQELVDNGTCAPEDAHEYVELRTALRNSENREGRRSEVLSRYARLPSGREVSDAHGEKLDVQSDLVKFILKMQGRGHNQQTPNTYKTTSSDGKFTNRWKFVCQETGQIGARARGYSNARRSS
jgi:hypothetical protein